MQYPNILSRSPIDNRDWIYEGLVLTIPVSLPKEFDLRTYLGPVRDQGNRGTCAAFSAACIKEYHEKIDNPDNFSGYMSPDSIYFYRSNKPQEGMYLRDVMSILSKRGTAREEFCPYSSVEPRSLSKECVADASRFVIKGYAQINTVSAAKQALMTSGPLLFAFPYYENGLAEFWKPKGQLAGGHAVTCVGWNENGFILRNSWGPKWNGDGHVIFRYEDFGLHWEIWSCVDAETVWEIPKPVPVPPKPTPVPRPTPRLVPVPRPVPVPRKLVPRR